MEEPCHRDVDILPHTHTGASTHIHKRTHTREVWGSEWVRRPTGRGGIVRVGAQPNAVSYLVVGVYRPAKPAWLSQGGSLMESQLSCLSLPQTSQCLWT